jgi:hypothetical protein
MCGKGSQSGGGTGALGWGGLAPAQQATTQASPQALGWYNQAMGMAQNAVAQPYKQFGTTAQDFVAQLNPQQQAAQQGLQYQAAATQPFASQGAALTYGAGLANPAMMAQQYMNPYMNQVVSPVQQAIQQQQGQQLAQQQADAIKGGAFGGERAGLQRATLMGQQNLGLGQALSPLYQTGYGQALGAAQGQIGNQLTAGQNLTGQGLAAQQASLGAGTLGQQTQQAGINALYNQFQQQQMFPYMQAQFLGGLAGGLGPLTGQQTYQAQAQNPFGMFLARGGRANSKERMGGAVIDLTPGKDYYRGGVVGRQGYNLTGAVDTDPAALAQAQAKMYEEMDKAEKAQAMPTGQIQGSHGLTPGGLGGGSQQKQKSPLESLLGLGKMAGEAGSALGLGKMLESSTSPSSVTGLGKSLNLGNFFPQSWSGTGAADYIAPAAETAADTAGGAGLFGGVGEALGGIGSAITGGLESLGPLAALFALKDGGRVGYYDGGLVGRRGYEGEGFVKPSDDFERNVEQTFKFEGGLNPSDTNRTPSMYGINQAAHPGIDVRKLSRDQAKDIYRKEYWEGINADKLPEDIRGMAYDTAVMAGPGRARQFLKQSGNDPEKFMAAREAFLNNLVARDPEKYGKYEKAWANRNEALRGGVGDALSNLPPNARSYYAQANLPEEGSTVNLSGGVKPSEEGFGLNRQTVVPLLSGLGAALEGMVSSPTTSLGGAMLRGAGAGLGAGAKSYMDVGKQIPEIEKLKAEVPKLAAETKERENLAARAAAETKEKLSTLYEKQWVPNVGWMVYDKTQPYKTPVQISDADGNPTKNVDVNKIPTRGGGERIEDIGKKSLQEKVQGKERKVGDAIDWQPTLAAPKDTKIPGALNIAMSGDLPKQQEAAKKEVEGLRTTSKAAFDQLYRLDEMEHQFDQLPKEANFLEPGPASQARTDLAKTANEITTMLGGQPLFDPNNVAAAEALSKDTTRLGFDVARSLGHEPGFIVQSAVKANPGMENSPIAYKRISSGLREAAKYQQDRLAFMEDYAARFGTLTGADATFRKLNPPERYVNRAILEAIDKDDMGYLKSLTKDQVKSSKGEIDKMYGKGVAAILLGEK